MTGRLGIFLVSALILGGIYTPTCSGYHDHDQGQKYPYQLRYRSEILASSESEEISGRVVGGRNAAIGEAPYQLRLTSRTPEGRDRSCGAVLVEQYNVQFALTAAHCVYGGYPTRHHTVDPTKARLVAADHRLSGRQFEQYRNATKIIMHEQYDGTNKINAEHDIAILFYERPFRITKYAKTIDLPLQNYGQPKQLFVSGWGSTTTRDDGHNPADILQVAWVPTIENSVCKNFQLNGVKITPKQICTRQDGVGTCLGDSGGPAVAKKWEGDLYLVGITSYIRGDCGDDYYSTVFVRVSAYVDWIKTKVNEYSWS